MKAATCTFSIRRDFWPGAKGVEEHGSFTKAPIPRLLVANAPSELAGLMMDRQSRLWRKQAVLGRQKGEQYMRMAGEEDVLSMLDGRVFGWAAKKKGPLA